MPGDAVRPGVMRLLPAVDRHAALPLGQQPPDAAGRAVAPVVHVQREVVGPERCPALLRAGFVQRVRRLVRHEPLVGWRRPSPFRSLQVPLPLVGGRAPGDTTSSLPVVGHDPAAVDGRDRPPRVVADLEQPRTAAGPVSLAVAVQDSRHPLGHIAVPVRP